MNRDELNTDIEDLIGEGSVTVEPDFFQERIKMGGHAVPEATISICTNRSPIPGNSTTIPILTALV